MCIKWIIILEPSNTSAGNANLKYIYKKSICM